MCVCVCRYVAVETLAQQWQRMGVEPPHNQSLEDALREVTTICVHLIIIILHIHVYTRVYIIIQCIMLNSSIYNICILHTYLVCFVALL